MHYIFVFFKSGFGFILTLLFVYLFFTPLAVFAVDVDQNVTLTLPSDSSNYTLWQQAVSFDSLTVNTDNFSFGLVNGSDVEVTSADNKKLTTSSGSSYECQSDDTSYVNLTGSAAVTITITPSGSCGGRVRVTF